MNCLRASIPLISTLYMANVYWSGKPADKEIVGEQEPWWEYLVPLPIRVEEEIDERKYKIKEKIVRTTLNLSDKIKRKKS